jgi:3'(2'), 5'-bisphosphate nucleotidase
MLDLALSLDSELGAAVRMAHDAGKLIRDLRRSGIEARRKADKSIVTQADLDADALISRELTRLYPSDGILSEESGFTRGESGRTWVVDPLDGTSGYASGGNDYAVQIGLLVDGRALLGVVVEPERNRIYRALVGVGTFLSSAMDGTMRQLKVSKKAVMSEMTLVTSSRIPSETVRALGAHLGTELAGRTHSVGCKVGRLARREADLYFSAHPVSYWDSCGPSVVLAAAGGMLTDLHGAPLSFELDVQSHTHDSPLAASNGHAHGEFCRKVRHFLSLDRGGPSDFAAEEKCTH